MALTLIDRHLLRTREHYHLREGDRCYYLREYTSGRGYQHSETNQLISNFKIAVGPDNEHRRHYKQRAIVQVAAELSRCINEAQLAQVTWVPIPPSKVKSDRLYDDRLLRTLKRVNGAQVAPLLEQRASTDPAHQSSDSRPTPEQLIANYKLIPPASPPQRIVIFDDVVTTGAHFRAASTVLAEAFPNARIEGIFIARRIMP